MPLRRGNNPALFKIDSRVWLAGICSALLASGCDNGGNSDIPPSPDLMLGLNDVSVLFPMPPTATDLNVLRLSDQGVGGPLLPQAWFDEISVFADEPQQNQTYASWAIVGMRLDPCFPDLKLLATDPARCRRQVRLIAQPIAEDLGAPGGTVGAAGGEIEPAVAIDSAIHLLYDLNETEFAHFLVAWKTLLATTSPSLGAPLQVNPVIASQGLAGPFARGVRQLVLASVGKSRLGQVTFMEGRGVEWEFGGIRIINGERQLLAIAGLADEAAATQQFDQPPESGFLISPVSSASGGLMALAGDVVDNSFVLTAPPTEIDDALQLALEIDNPATSFHADSLDCASCHVAGRARRRAEDLGYSTAGFARYTHPSFDLTQTTNESLARDVTILRAFGFAARSPIVNDRVIHESAAVADALNNM
ncbi:MAG: hypothetical protein IPL79_15510 [Myxococcales bacterium]|nr:hypothetical protein [Myxococcales bacterium]